MSQYIKTTLSFDIHSPIINNCNAIEKRRLSRVQGDGNHIEIIPVNDQMSCPGHFRTRTCPVHTRTVRPHGMPGTYQSKARLVQGASCSKLVFSRACQGHKCHKLVQSRAF